jgi:hypothetical protein
LTQAVDLKKFEEFQGRVFHTALVLWTAALAISLVVSWGYSAVLGGILIGGVAGLLTLRYRIWTLRRLANEPTAGRARRLPWVGAVRYLIMGAALAAAAALAHVSQDSSYLFAAVGGLFVGNAAILVQAVIDSRRNAGT